MAGTSADLSCRDTYGLEEEDERNPACIAGNVDDKVEDVVGQRHDVFGLCVVPTWTTLTLVTTSEAICPVLNSSLRIVVGVMTLVLRHAMYRVHEEKDAMEKTMNDHLTNFTMSLCLVVVVGSRRARQSIECSHDFVGTTIWPLHRLRHEGIHLQINCRRAKREFLSSSAQYLRVVRSQCCHGRARQVISA